MDFAAPPPDLRRLTLGREGFAVRCPLALAGAASYPVLVHRPTASLPASFSAGLPAGPVSRLVALRFMWVAATNFPKDFHLLSTSMLGTHRSLPPCGGKAFKKRRRRFFPGKKPKTESAFLSVRFAVALGRQNPIVKIHVEIQMVA